MREATDWELRNRKGIIYLFHNKINGKNYVGKTINTFIKRYGSARQDQKINLNQISSNYFRRAIKKHGKENFSIHILEINKTSEDLCFYEEFYAEVYNCYAPHGYNLFKIGTENITFANSDCKKVSFDINRKKKHNFEFKSPEGEVFITNNLSEFCRDKKLAASGMWKVFSGQNRYYNGWTRVNTYLKIYSIKSPDGEIFNIKEGYFTKFCRDRNLSHGAMAKVIDGIYNHHKGWTRVDISSDTTLRIKADPNSNTEYQLLSPSGDIIKICHKNLKAFCIENDLNPKCILRILRGHLLHHKFWSLPSIRLEKYEFLGPNDELVIFDKFPSAGSLKNFCEFFNLNYGCMCNISFGFTKNHKGWRLAE